MFRATTRAFVCLHWVINPLLANSYGIPLADRSLSTEAKVDICALRTSKPERQGCCLGVARQCGRELLSLLQAQFPWRPNGDPKSIMDPKDSLDHLCGVYDCAIKCIEAAVSNIQDECVMYAFSGNFFEVYITMSFLCRKPDRLALMRSLQCLSGKGALNSLGLRAWKTCGIEILANQTKAMKSALFFVSNLQILRLPSELLQKIQKSLFCVPKGYLHCFLSNLRGLCGVKAESLVKDYFTHLQQYIADVWLPNYISKENICRNDVRQQTPFANGKPRDKTALETRHGRELLNIFHNQTLVNGLCHNKTIDVGYRVMVHSLFVEDEPVRFNLFHFAHGLTIFRPLSVPCHTGDFTKITRYWELWRNVCPSVRSYVYPVTVLIEGCRLYALFGSQYGHCQWEDILMTIYARAAAITKSPNTGHWLPGGSNYLLLDGMYEYYSVQQWADYTRRPLALIRQSLDEITFKCGKGMTSTLMAFYKKLEYYMFDSILQRKSLNS